MPRGARRLASSTAWCRMRSFRKKRLCRPLLKSVKRCSRGAKSSNRRPMRDLPGSQPPARAGNLLRRALDMFFEADQLPVARAVGKGETGLAGKADHDIVGAQRIAEQTFGAERCRPAFEVFEQCRTDALALPAVVDRQAELETRGIGIERVAGFADDGLDAIDWHRRDHGETVGLADMDEMVELLLRQLAHRAEEAVVAGADRERPEVTLQRVSIARLDEAHHHRLAGTQPQHIGMLPEVVELKRDHGRRPGSPEKTMAGAPPWRQRRRA